MADDGGVTGGEAVELDNLIISLIGDPSGYLDSLKEVIAQTNEAAQKIVAGGSKLVAAFEEQIATFGMTTREVALYRAEVEGAGTAEIETARRLHEQLTQMEEQRRSAAAAEQERLALQATAEQRQQAVMAQGANVTRSLETAEERRGRQVQEVTQLLQAGAISQETYARAMTKLAEQSRSAKDALQGVTTSLLGMAGAFGVAGTASAMFSAFGRYEANTLALNAALKDQDRDVGRMTQRYKEFVGQMRDTAALSVGMTKQMLQQAAMYDIFGAAAERVVRRAATISTMLGSTDPTAGFQSALQLEQGILPHQLSRRMGMGRGAGKDDMGEKDKADQIAEIASTVDSKFGMVEARAQTVTAELSKLGSGLAGVSVQAGGMLAEAVRPVIGILNDMVKAFQDTDESTRKVVVTLVAAAAGFAVLNSGLPAAVEGIKLLAANFGTLVASFLTNPFALVVAGVVAVTLAVKELAGYLVTATDKLDSLAASASKFEAMSSKLGHAKREQTNKILQTAEGKDSEEDTARYLKGELDRAEKEFAGVSARAESLKKTQNDISLLGKFGRGTVGRLFGADAQEQQELKDATNTMEQARDRVDKIRGALEKLDNSHGFGKLNEDVRKYRESLKDAAATAGMTEDDKKLFGFEKRGANEKGAGVDLVGLAMLQQQTNARLAEEKLADDVQNLKQKLREQAETFGITANEVELYKLSLRGATDEDLAAVRAKQDLTETLEKQRKMMQDGAKVAESVRNPQEKFDARLGELNELVNEGAISFDTYGRAVEQARQSLLGAKEAMNGIQQAGAGSADAISRLEAFRDKMNDLSGGKGREQAVALAAERAHAEGRELPYPGDLPRGKTDPFGARPDREASTASVGHELDEVARAVEAAAQDRMEHEVLDIVADWEQWAKEVEEKTAVVPPPVPEAADAIVPPPPPKPTDEDRVESSTEAVPVPEIKPGKTKDDPRLTSTQTDLMTKMLAALNKLVDKPVAEFEGAELA